MPIKFRCPHCQQFLGISEQKAETITDCPTCGRSIRVPSLDGKVRPLPELKLNLEDEHLRAALGALATFDEPLPTHKEVPPRPQPVSRGEAKIQLEVVPQPASMLIAEPVSIPHVEDVPGQDVPFEESLRQLQDLPVREPKTVSTRKPAIQFGPAAVLGIALLAILLGGVIGRSFRKPASSSSAASAAPKAFPARPAQPVPPKLAAAAPATARLDGQVTTIGPTGEKSADRGARILLLPLKRIGTGKISGEGFRSGSDAADQNLLAASVGALEGTVGTADESGNFEVAAPRTGRYCLLIASNHQGREPNGSISDECRKFLETYFDRPQHVLGNVDFLYTEVTLEAGKLVSKDVRFPQE